MVPPRLPSPSFSYCLGPCFVKLGHRLQSLPEETVIGTATSTSALSVSQSTFLSTSNVCFCLWITSLAISAIDLTPNLTVSLEISLEASSCKSPHIPSLYVTSMTLSSISMICSVVLGKNNEHFQWYPSWNLYHFALSWSSWFSGAPLFLAIFVSSLAFTVVSLYLVAFNWDLNSA